LQPSVCDPISADGHRAAMCFQVKSGCRNFWKQKSNELSNFRFALFPICNVTLIKLCGIVHVAAAERSSMAMSVVDLERDGSAGFSDLYVHLLKTALDEMHPSLSPEMREQNLAAHIACGISMSGLVSQPLRD
jgi:hypothetical protein